MFRNTDVNHFFKKFKNSLLIDIDMTSEGLDCNSWILFMVILCCFCIPSEVWKRQSLFTVIEWKIVMNTLFQIKRLIFSLYNFSLSFIVPNWNYVNGA